MWPLLSRGQPVTVAMHDALIKEVAWIPEMSLLATGSWDKTIKYWDTRQSNPVHTKQLLDRCYTMSVGHLLMVVGTADRNLIVFNLHNPQPYKPPIPYPQRLAKSKTEAQFKRFVELLKQLNITIPFTEAITEMPSYDNETITLTAECSAIIQNNMPPKLKDPGSFSIPCVIGKTIIEKALCDLGASVSLMPLSTCKKLNLGELKATRMSLQLADRSVKYPVGMLENIPVRVGQFYIPTDFIIMDIQEDSNIPIILGRPFLATAGAIIDVKRGKLTFEVGEEKIEFILSQFLKAPSIID
ncbi:uncharacterized protein LOC131662618, partial [Vicia villosa]|uniref:uncharacterized protein LOC131662618 n=1 Tax=Vicia villosa TaxID=3911 RepID=UPI00273A89A5